MISPYPSYPPLEMAEAGVLTVTNKYGQKNLSRRFPEIISIEHVDAELLADAIGAAVREAEIQRIGKIVPRRSPRDLSSDQALLHLPKSSPKLFVPNSAHEPPYASLSPRN
jgi:hypothetical protein